MLRPLRERLPRLIGAQRRQRWFDTRHCYQVFVSKNPLGAPFVEKSRGTLEASGSALCQDVVQRWRKLSASLLIVVGYPPRKRPRARFWHASSRAACRLSTRVAEHEVLVVTVTPKACSHNRFPARQQRHSSVRSVRTAYPMVPYGWSVMHTGNFARHLPWGL